MSAAVVVLACIGLPLPVLAEPGAPPRPSDPDAAAAQALFDEGRSLMKQGRPREACPKFEQSQELDPGLGTKFNLANCLEELDKLATAHALFLEVAEAARATGQKQRERVAQARADALEPRLPKLAILAPPGSNHELEVELDGVRQDQWGSPVPIDPGVHRVRASGPDLGEWSTEVRIPSDPALHQVLIPEAAETSFFASTNHKLALAALGVAVVGLGTASYFTVRALDQKARAEDAGCRGKQCPTPAGVDLRHQASNAGTLATVGVGIGAIGLAAAAAFLWIVPEPGSERPAEGATLELTPVVAPGVGALLLGASF
ncbi:MAG TPA: tetratricopeptide repeat protein [Polyangiaceae bacterium]|nr:tetratricopeptide repeat protein [Polyangiaceae bacterium]